MQSVLRLRSGFWHQMVYIVLMPIFFFAFSLIYDPFSIKEYFVFGGFGYGFHLSLSATILLVSLFITRMIFIKLYDNLTFKWWQYCLWCCAEVMLATLFIALYAWLFSSNAKSYLEFVSDCIRFTFLTLLYPYIFLVMVQIIKNKEDEIISESSPSGRSLIKFYDEHHKLRFTVDSASILYVIAEFNYIRIHYTQGGIIKEFSLRNSMKSQADSMAVHGMVRCHRSYYVNPQHVNMLLKDKDGFIYAHLDNDDAKPVPVSKQYYAELTSRL